MNDKQQAAMQMALDALEYHTEQTRPIEKTNEVIDMLKKELADAKEQPSPEQTAYWYSEFEKHNTTSESLAQPQGDKICIDWDAKTDTPVMGYKAQPQGEWVDLTDDEIHAAINEPTEDLEVMMWRANYCRAVIAKFKEKNK